VRVCEMRSYLHDSLLRMCMEQTFKQQGPGSGIISAFYDTRSDVHTVFSQYNSELDMRHIEVRFVRS
jgi:hypothetical protein